MAINELKLKQTTFLALDHSGTILRLTSEDDTFFGYPRAAVLDASVSSLFSENSQGVIEALIATPPADAIEGAVELVRPGGGRLALRVIALSDSGSGRISLLFSAAEPPIILEQILKNTDDAVFLHLIEPDGMPGRFLEVNDVACRRLGYERDELLRMRPVDVDTMGSSPRAQGVIDRLLSEKRTVFESTHKTRWGDEIPVEVTARAFRVGQELRVLSMARDVSSRKEAFDRIERLLREKETLLREIHHRVKNDMHLIKSYLSVQALESDSETVQEALGEAEKRILLMSGIYDTLYRSSTVKSIPLSSFLQLLLDDISKTFECVRVTYDAPTIEIPREISFPLGIVISELMTNAAKHAFHGVSDPHIQVEATLAGGRVLTCTVRDNGTGYAVDSGGASGGGGYGVQMMHALLEDLDGSLAYSKRGAGTSAVVEIPIE